jgi:hypothetical protein
MGTKYLISDITQDPAPSVSCNQMYPSILRWYVDSDCIWFPWQRNKQIHDVTHTPSSFYRNHGNRGWLNHSHNYAKSILWGRYYMKFSLPSGISVKTWDPNAPQIQIFTSSKCKSCLCKRQLETGFQNRPKINNCSWRATACRSLNTYVYAIRECRLNSYVYAICRLNSYVYAICRLIGMSMQYVVWREETEFT